MAPPPELQMFSWDLWVDFIRILAVAIASGAFGGLAAGLIRRDLSGVPEQEKTAGWSWFQYYFRSIIIGTAGAIGGLFFVYAVGGINKLTELNEQIRLVSTSLLFGYGARQILPKLLDGLAKEVAETKDQLKRVSEESRQNDRAIENELKELNEKSKISRNQIISDHLDNIRNQLIPKISTSKTPKINSDMLDEAIKEARELIDEEIAIPVVYIRLASIYRWLHDLPKALDILGKFIPHAENQDAKSQKDTNLHANWNTALYNRACYLSLQYKEDKSEDTLRSAISAINTYLREQPDKAEAIKELNNDENKDFGTIKDTPLFKREIKPK